MPDIMPAETAVRKTALQRLQGEWSWEKYIPGVLGVLCIADAVLQADGVRAFLRDGELQTGLILIIAAYLSELRYRLFMDVRNN